VEPEKTPRERAEDLISLLVSDWRPTPQQILWTVRIGIVLSLLVAIGYSYSITLWDWLKLLIVPAVIAAGGLWFNQQQQERQQEDVRRQRERELEIENQRAQDEALQAYLGQMGQMLLDKDRPLRQSEQDDEVRTLARARTLTVLSRLDSERTRSVLQFLYEAELITVDRRVLDLSDADLRGTDLSKAKLDHADLSRADLSGSNLVQANFGIAVTRASQAARGAWFENPSDRDRYLKQIILGANLYRTDLTGSNLNRAYLERADLRWTRLKGAHLKSASLVEANLRGADLRGGNLNNTRLMRANLQLARLEGADLSGANLNHAGNWTAEQLMAARSLEGANMPNGQKYEDWLRDREHRKEYGGNDGSSP